MASFSIFLACYCDKQGSLPEICNKDSGECMCKDGFNGRDVNGDVRCDK